MSSPFDTQILGCSLEVFAIICVIYAVPITLWLGQNAGSISLIAGLVFLTTWLWGMYSWMVLVVGGGVIVLGGIIFWLAQPCYSDGEARLKENITIGLVGLAVIAILAGLIYWFVGSDLWVKFLEVLPKIFIIVGVLGLVALFVWLAYRHIMRGRLRQPIPREDIGGNQEQQNQDNLQGPLDPHRPRRNPIPRRRDIGL